MKLKLFLILIFVSLSAFSNEKDHKHEEGETKPHRAESSNKGEVGVHEEAELPAGIVSFNDEEAEFTLKVNVINNFKIKAEAPESTANGLKIPMSSIVKSLDKLKVFIKKNNAFKAVDIKILKSEGLYVFISDHAVLKSALIVTSGTNFLQTIMLALEEGPSEGHGH